MTDGTIMALVYPSRSVEDISPSTLDVFASAGFDVDDPGEPNYQPSGERAYAIELPHEEGWSIRLDFDLDEQRDPKEPAVSVGRLTDHIYPPNVRDGDQYRRRMSGLFDVLCRLSIALDAEYVAVADTQGRIPAVLPTGRPYADAVDTLPQIGVFSASVLQDFGGVEAMYGNPWYAAELTSGQTVVIESNQPWSFGGWEPPTEADYLRSATLREESAADPTEDHQHRDPFAALDPGEYGTAFGVHPDDIAEEFRNEDLRLERVYVTEAGELRRIEDDAFVRHVVEERGDEAGELLQQSLDDVPPMASGDHLLASALFHWAIPPEFVRLDAPDGETVVSKVAALDADVSKYDLLLRLGDTTYHEDFDADALATMEGALDNLIDLADDESVDGVERVIEERLF